MGQSSMMQRRSRGTRWRWWGLTLSYHPPRESTSATARVRGLTLVTRNTADLARTGVPLLNPFEFRG
jgi:hypothetical protein